jgi:hypothetical protein
VCVCVCVCVCVLALAAAALATTECMSVCVCMHACARVFACMRVCVLVCVWNADNSAPARVETQELMHAHTVWRHHSERVHDVYVGHFDDVCKGHE